MRHRVAHRKLGRVTEHRISMLRNQAQALLRYEHIETTVPRAKELRPFVERLITIAKKNTLHARRIVISRLGPMAEAEVKPEKDDKGDADHRTVVQKLFSDIAPRFANRPGGYTRVLKRHEHRLGDAGATAFLELLKEGETRSRAKAAYTAPAPAPKVEEQPAPTPEQPAPTTGTASQPASE
jgi:large subunit ribosomal protein L17